MELANVTPREIAELRLMVAKQQEVIDALTLQRPSRTPPSPPKDDSDGYEPPESLYEPRRVLLFAIPPCGIMGWQHWNHDPWRAICYSLTFGLGGSVFLFLPNT